MITYKSGQKKLNAKGEAIEKFIYTKLQNKGPIEPAQLIDQLMEDGIGQIRDRGAKVAQEILQVTDGQLEKGLKLTATQARQRVAAASFGQLIDQNGGWGETAKLLAEGDTWSWIDFTSSLEEQLAEMMP